MDSRMLHFAVEDDLFPQGTADVKALLKTLYAIKTSQENESLVRMSVSLLAHLTTTAINADLLLRSSVVLYLQRVCNSSISADEAILSNVAYILFCLTDTPESVETIVREDVISVLIQLSRAPHESVKELCIVSLCRMSTFTGLSVEMKLVEQGALEAAMIMALVATKSHVIKTLCVKMISNCLCAESKHCTKAMVDHGVFWALRCDKTSSESIYIYIYHT
jgi:hypothetical protein